MPVKLTFSEAEAMKLRREFHITIGYIEGIQSVLAEMPMVQAGLNASLNRMADVLEIEHVKQRELF